jgi:glycosyltransferase involved in cell wall biosynthesis
MSKPTTVLYISYNSLTDQLAQSQVLPYLVELGKEGYTFLLISCEKKDSFEKEKQPAEQFCNANGIVWHPVFYHTGLSIFSKFIDVSNIKKLAVKLWAQHHYKIVHCRSYIASLAGLYLKKNYPIKFIFDSREFWANEQVDNGSWNLKHPLYKLVYQFFKQKEKQFAAYADAIVNLSNNGKAIFSRWYPEVAGKIYVVPCVADFTHFKPELSLSKSTLRQQLGLPLDVPIAVHLGALAPNYLINQTVDFFKVYQQKYPGAVLLFLCKTQHELIQTTVAAKGLQPSAVIIKAAGRNLVPDYLNACDIALCFMIPCEAKKSASPIKIGEYAAVNLPVVATNVGDIKEIYTITKAGVVIENFTAQAYQQALTELENIDRENIRNSMAPFFSLPRGVEIYKKLYRTL